MLVGNIGAEGKKMDYTVIGDNVNIGARVETLTRKFKTNILMTELHLNEIQELVKSNRMGHVSIKGVGRVVVKGKEEAEGAFKIAEKYYNWIVSKKIRKTSSTNLADKKE